jgi:hypothetical protein
VIRQNAFVAAGNLFVELRGVEVPINASWLFDAILVNVYGSVLSAQVFSN